ncbi:MAG TPA: thioredoxin domain-containing protein [Flavobacteriales bacterium]|jgi:uncharacterized protein YyaL (SSP411 family)|nr:thioredoxin domain-containing protein [Flavobacteriales bacterium]
MLHTNELVHETSPYLLQHAHNPVEWYPWGEKALRKAKDEDKLILISVGYSACHWCHVMAHESFEDEEVASIMNQHFVNIKIDREERPDIDQVYMTAVQLMTQRGGWPLNCIALPDGRPFFGGTYFPKHQWKDILLKIVEEYQKNRPALEEYAHKLTEGIAQSEMIVKSSDTSEFSVETLDEMVTKWRKSFDPTWGGPDRAPKFPLPNNYEFLMHYAFLRNDSKLDEHLRLTLTKMAYGGIYDHLGGGFARYSTDKEWKVPHFEKMLYDNAQLIGLYAQAYTRFRDPLFKNVVYQTVDFLDRELSDGNGVYYSALDADSKENEESKEAEEGLFYIWKEADLQRIAGKDYNLIADYYNIGNKTRWEHGRHIIMRFEDEGTVALRNNLAVEELKEKVSRFNENAFNERASRPRPGLDDKSLTSWNALLISGLAKAYKAFHDPTFLKKAEAIAEFILEKQLQKDGSLRHSFKKGRSTINGYLEDYTFTIEGLLALYEVTFDEKWLDRSKELIDYSIDHFFDQNTGMFYFTSDLDPDLITRTQELSDNVIPASNSSMAKNLFRIGHLLDSDDYLRKSEQMLRNIIPQMPSYGPGYSNWGMLLMYHTFPYFEIAISGKEMDEKRAQMGKFYLPNSLYLGAPSHSDLPLLENKYVDGQTLIYVCVNKSCQLPTSNVQEALKQVRKP